MANFNRVILMGNVTRDIELKYTQSNLAVTEMGLAVHDRRKNQAGEWVDETTFVDVTLWGRTAEVASEYLGKGSPVFVEGRLKLDTWEADGQKRSRLRVVGERIQLLGRGSGNGNGPAGTTEPRAATPHSRNDQRTSFNSNEYSEPATTSGSGAPGSSVGEDDIPF